MTEEVTQEIESSTEVAQETNAETTPTESFSSSITDPELKAYVDKAGYKDINGVLKSAMHLEKKMGAPKEVEKYEADAYTYELPESYQANDEILGSVKSRAIELGIKPEAFKDLVETFTNQEHGIISKMQSDAETEFQAQLKEESSFIKEKTGVEADALIESSKTTWGNFVDPRYKDTFDNFDKGTQLVLADMLTNIASKISEPSLGKPSGGNSIGKEAAIEKINQLRSDTTLSQKDLDDQLAPLYAIAY